MNQDRLSLTRYVLVFLGVYALLTAAVVAFVELTGIELNSGVNMGVAIASAMAAGQKFVKDHGRLPSKSERHRLTAASVLWSLLLSSAALGAWFWIAGAWGELVELVNSLGGTVVAISVLVALIVYCLVLWISYGWLLRKVAGQVKTA